MRASLRYVLLTAARTRTPLVPVSATAFALIGVYAYRPNEPGETFALTAVLACGLAAWLVAAVLGGEPRAQAEMAVAALGGRRRRTAMDVLLIAVVAAVLGVLFLGYPLALGLVLTDVFAPSPSGGDLLAAAVAHLAAALLGGALALLCSPPRVARPATTAALLVAALVALAAIGGVTGPVAAAAAVDDGDTGALVASVLGCVALAVVAVVAADRWAARAG
jgi:hypothetical protein